MKILQINDNTIELLEEELDKKLNSINKYILTFDYESGLYAITNEDFDVYILNLNSLKQFYDGNILPDENFVAFYKKIRNLESKLILVYSEDKESGENLELSKKNFPKLKFYSKYQIDNLVKTIQEHNK